MTVFKVNNRPAPKSWNGIVNDLFSNFENNFGTALAQTSFNGTVPVNIFDSENNYILELVAPGFSKEQITLNVENHVLTIAGENKNENTENNGLKQIRKEFTAKSFKRSFTLDDKINAEGIAAKYADGILKVTFPKKAEEKPEVKQITVE